ncbi:MAG TPA: phasin family protein [Burkholderiales bacterium]|nr:phasin family protein [Burkholderiales bacterium]
MLEAPVTLKWPRPFHLKEREISMQAQFVDLYRAGIRSATDMMKLSLEHTERLQQQQLQLIRQALDESTRSTAQAGEVKGLDDVVAFNSRIAGAQLERVGEFWANWWRAAGDMQKSMIDQFQSQIGHAKDLGREGYSFASRAAEDTARLASQAANAQERERKEHRKSA